MLSICCRDFAYNYLEGTITSECAMNLTFASIVTYDSRAIVIDGKHHVLVFDSIHYPRSTPDYNFEGRNDLVKFVKLVAAAGLYVNPRIEPYACAKPYIKWAVDMVVSLDTGVPWVMCQQYDALNPIISLGFQDLGLQVDPSLLLVMIMMLRLMSAAAVYKTGSLCSAFLANVDTKSDATVKFNGNSYLLPTWSVSILSDCKNVVLNTAKINSQTVIPSFMHESLNTNANSTDSIVMDTRKMLVVWIVAMFCFSLLRFTESKVAKEEGESKFKI
ncbi:hypothetical protein F3Y22_tig00111989pilonHSYRG00140 [Hibiscus syriacus]|uniref:beta-galactosidase n=1 Tax=Hibiscus syriacus TaxID=106335 RepID=A0A6A2XWJ2_HIBSY|nr:hypothetical protein F3Y22_tig00111989pilonHSYRG00140 [Hibiscus syriacus]